MSSSLFVLHAALFHLLAVGEFGVFSEVEGPVHKRAVEVVDVAIIAEAGGAGLFVRSGFAEGDVAGLPDLAILWRGLWNFTGVDFVGEVAIDNVIGPDGGGERAHLRVDAADAGDEEVGVGEIEARIEADSHDGGGGACCAYSG